MCLFTKPDPGFLSVLAETPGRRPAEERVRATARHGEPSAGSSRTKLLGMLVCTTPQFVRWTPDFSSSEQSSPNWTKLVCGDVELCNGIEWIDWDDDPVQVRLCESCGHTHCEVGGYVRITRIGPHLLWTRPRITSDDAWEHSQFTLHHPLEQTGAVLIRVDDWNSWRDDGKALPEATIFPPASRWDLAQAWLMDAPIGRANRFWKRSESRGVRSLEEAVQGVRETIVAADGTTTERAVAEFDRVAQWLGEAPDEQIEGEVVETSQRGAAVHALHLDDGRVETWRAVAEHDGHLTPVLGETWMLTPEPVEER